MTGFRGESGVCILRKLTKIRRFLWFNENHSIGRLSIMLRIDVCGRQKSPINRLFIYIDVLIHFGLDALD